MSLEERFEKIQSKRVELEKRQAVLQSKQQDITARREELLNWLSSHGVDVDNLSAEKDRLNESIEKEMTKKEEELSSVESEYNALMQE